ncbi:MAG: orotate phosphoribosyltransferase [Candidatus Dormibacteria bacterium]
MTDAEREELRGLLHLRSFRYGDFVLSSGRTSNFYFDGKQVTLDARGLHLVGRSVLERCRAVGVEAVGGLTLGADPIAAAVAALSGGDGGTPVRAFIVRKEAKEHGTGRAIEGAPLGPGVRCAIVDDVVTTGGALLRAVEAVRETGAEVVEAIVVVDREEGGRETLAAEGVALHALYQRSQFPAPAPAV